ncbi:hypothetical protein LOD99_1762 [Oopsacas minuta]|uniref:Phosphoribulokinase/uridine kinase domain-containing protein n=1 Tax=Oopsacas minuta TaxID=111878 RepID=A0AAV7K4B1_9METZ|nr:hypothetical protein LOD99_1762 [Oopsacas minuta]
MHSKPSFDPICENGNQILKPFLIGVTGGSASGKTTVCEKIIEQLGAAGIANQEKKVSILNQDSFYKDLTQEEHRLAAVGDYNFDHPDSFDKEFDNNVIKISFTKENYSSSNL